MYIYQMRWHNINDVWKKTSWQHTWHHIEYMSVKVNCLEHEYTPVKTIATTWPVQFTEPLLFYFSTAVIPPRSFPSPCNSSNLSCFDFFHCTPYIPVYFSLVLSPGLSLSFGAMREPSSLPDGIAAVCKYQAALFPPLFFLETISTA